jgi:pseudaminic acid synthase
MPPMMTIDGRPVGPGHPPYIVAEMSGNHNGEIGRALAILDAAKAAGADSVKLQTYRADTITIDHDGPDFRVGKGLWEGQRLYDLYRDAHTPWEWHEPLFRHAREIGITIFSAPFDPTAVELLESLDAPVYKIASSEIVDIPLIRLVARTGKPLILSTGMATFAEIEEAVAAARDAGAKEIAILHCISAYPTPIERANLSNIPDLAERLGTVVGLSDHSMGTLASTVAIGLGAALIEKHFTLARADGGVDSAFSLEPAELATLVADTRAAQAALGTPVYGPTEAERDSLRFRRSLYVVADLKKGETITEASVRSIRPAHGLLPKYLDAVLGRKASRDLKRGEAFKADMVEGGVPGA